MSRLFISKTPEQPPLDAHEWHVFTGSPEGEDSILASFNGKIAHTITPPFAVPGMLEDGKTASDTGSTWSWAVWSWPEGIEDPQLILDEHSDPLSVTSMDFQEVADLLRKEAPEEGMEWLARQTRTYYFSLRNLAEITRKNGEDPNEIQQTINDLLLDAARELGEAKVKAIIDPRWYLRVF